MKDQTNEQTNKKNYSWHCNVAVLIKINSHRYKRLANKAYICRTSVQAITHTHSLIQAEEV